MKIETINNEAEYKAALKSVSTYFENEPEPGSPDSDYFLTMLELIIAYEAKAFA